MTRRSVATIAAATGALLVVSSAAHALPQIRFDNPDVDGGSVFYDGNSGPLVGRDIIFGNIIGTGTPANSGVELTCDGCLLNFTTGPNISEPGSPGDPWVFSATGSSFVVTGRILDGANVIFSGGSILEGVITSNVFVSRDEDPDRLAFIALGADDKVEQLLAFYGLTDPAFTFAQTGITFEPDIEDNLGFQGEIDEADIVNRGSEVSAIPEPTTLGLLGVGLVALGAAFRRRVAG